jgi:hypothetical protein
MGSIHPSQPCCVQDFGVDVLYSILYCTLNPFHSMAGRFSYTFFTSVNITT